MSRRKRKNSLVVHKEIEPIKTREVPVVDKVHQKCPHCQSTRSILLWSEPGKDGRMEIRRCKGCLKKFKTWDPLESKG